jgi:hypothetical protein
MAREVAVFLLLVGSPKEGGLRGACRFEVDLGTDVLGANEKTKEAVVRRRNKTFMVGGKLRVVTSTATD